MVLIGLYLFIGLYHLFMFLVRRNDRHNLFYGLFSLDLGVYLLMRTSTITLLGLDSNLIYARRALHALLHPSSRRRLPRDAQRDQDQKSRFWYGAFCALDRVGRSRHADALRRDLLLVWQLSGLVMAFFYFGVDILGRFLSDGRRRWKRALGAGAERRTEGGRSLGGIYLKALVRTPIGNLLIGGAILFATGLFDIVDAI